MNKFENVILGCQSGKTNQILSFIDSVQKTSSTQTTLPNGDYFIGFNTPADTSYLHGTIKRVDIWKGTGF